MKHPFIKTVLLLTAILLTLLVWYGVKTDCPNTATYVRCGGITL